MRSAKKRTPGAFETEDPPVIALPNASWVFGYGSLMWNPGFPFIEQQPAQLYGFHRSFCMYSQHHRGTPETPGLVLGLDVGGHCPGVAFRVAPKHWPLIYTYLNERELVGDYAYVPKVVEVILTTGPVAAFTYVANPDHQNYAGALPIDTAVAIILRASGIGGRNQDYLIELVRKLESLGHHDPHLHTLLERVKVAGGH